MCNISEVSQWVYARLPAALLSGPPEVALYDDEVVIVLPIVGAPGGAAAGPNEQRQAEYRLIAERREETRQLRMKLARELQKQLDLPIAGGCAWAAARCCSPPLLGTGDDPPGPR